jgi:hypothetical protein
MIIAGYEPPDVAKRLEVGEDYVMREVAYAVAFVDWPEHHRPQFQTKEMYLAMLERLRAERVRT